MTSIPASTVVASSCVWKVTGPNGGTLYLGGSVHALRRSDYPLPAAYNTALAASSHIVFEDDPKAEARATKELLRQGRYSKGDTLRITLTRARITTSNDFLRWWTFPKQNLRNIGPGCSTSC